MVEEKRAGWLAGSAVALVLIHNPCHPPSRQPMEVEEERERKRKR